MVLGRAHSDRRPPGVNTGRPKGRTTKMLGRKKQPDRGKTGASQTPSDGETLRHAAGGAAGLRRYLLVVGRTSRRSPTRSGPGAVPQIPLRPRRPSSALEPSVERAEDPGAGHPRHRGDAWSTPWRPEPGPTRTRPANRSRADGRSCRRSVGQPPTADARDSSRPCDWDSGRDTPRLGTSSAQPARVGGRPRAEHSRPRAAVPATGQQALPEPRVRARVRRLRQALPAALGHRTRTSRCATSCSCAWPCAATRAATSPRPTRLFRTVSLSRLPILRALARYYQSTMLIEREPLSRSRRQGLSDDRPDRRGRDRRQVGLGRSAAMLVPGRPRRCPAVSCR